MPLNRMFRELYDEVEVAEAVLRDDFTAQITAKLAQQYHENLGTNILHLDMPRRSGKTTWLHKVACDPRYDTMRVFGNYAMLQHAPPVHSEHNVDYSVGQLVANHHRNDPVPELILFDDVYNLPETRRLMDTDKTIMDLLLIGNLNAQFISLYTGSE